MWFLTLHRHIRPRAEGREAVLDEHLGWNYRQQQAGRILFSGPVFDRRFQLGCGAMTEAQRRAYEALSDEDRAFVGVMVVSAASAAEAEALLRDEPFVRGGYRVFEVFEWDVHQMLGVGPFSRATLEATLTERAQRRLRP